MTPEPKEQAVPVVGVEEAVKRLSGFSRALSNRRIAFKAAFSQAYGRDAGPQKSALNRDLRTILQALHGSSAGADTHRATEQPVVDEPTPEFLEPFARRWCIDNGIDPDEPVPPHGEWPRWYDCCGEFAAMYRDIAAKMSQQASVSTGEKPGVGEGPEKGSIGHQIEMAVVREKLRQAVIPAAEECGKTCDCTYDCEVAFSASGEAALGGDEAEGGVNHLQAQLKAAYEALEEIAAMEVWNSAWAEEAERIARQALARRGEGNA